MNKRDKDKLLILLVIVAYIAITVGMIVGTSYLDWKAIIAITIALEYFIIQPRLCRLYYEANNSKAGIGRFIPFWNEIMMFKSSNAIATLVSYATLALSIVVFFIPIEFIGNLFGDKIMLNFGVLMIRVIAVLIVVNCICVGIGFMNVGTKIRRMHAEFTDGGHQFATGSLATILLFIPIVRVVILAGYMNLLIKLVVLNNYAQGVKNAEQLVEEN